MLSIHSNVTSMNGQKSRNRPLLARAFGIKPNTNDSAQIQLLTNQSSAKQHCFLAIPVKSTVDVDLIKPLTKFFEASSTNLSVNVADLKIAIEAFNRLRSFACTKSSQDLQLHLSSVAEYYDQLSAFECKLIAPSSPRLEGFKWKDAFDSGKSFLTKSHTMEADIAVERLAILFNYGALLSQIASSQHMDTDEEKRMSAKLFQQSAGVFAYLKDAMQHTFVKQCTSDLRAETLSLFCNLMLAQAQECVYTKAYDDKMNTAALAKISAQSAEYYMDLNKIMNLEATKSYWKKDWLNIVAGKSYGFQAIAQMHQAQVNLENQEIAERMTRLKSAYEQMQAAKRHLPESCLREIFSEIDTEYSTAMRENKLIYQAQIGDVHALPAIPKATLVKAIPISSPLNPAFKDVFSSVIPANVLNITQNYDRLKNERLRMEADRLNENTELMEGIIASLGISEEMSPVPETIRRYSAEVKAAGGLKELQAKLNEVSNLRARIKEIVADIEKTLGKESRSDAELQQRLGVKCHRMASNGLTEPFLKEISKARTALTSTLEEDKVSKKKFGENWQSIETLSKPEKELYLLFPPRPNRLGEKTPEAMSFLLKLLDKAQEIKCERVELLKEINAKRTSTPVDVMIPIISQSKFCSDDTIIKEKVKEICEPIKEEVDKSLKKQTTLMNDVEKWSTRFSAHASSKSPIGRTHIEKSLSYGYEVFRELNSKLPKRVKHCHSLLDSLLRLQEKVNDFCFARETEKDELLRTYQHNVHIQTASVSESTSFTPPVLPRAQVSFVPLTIPPYNTEGYINAPPPNILAAPAPTPSYPIPSATPLPQQAFYQQPSYDPQQQVHLPQYGSPPPPYQLQYPNYPVGQTPWHSMGQHR